mmetsp:Transcript_10517/g.33440  ORF Transcript_10517/g.33440 Transcript_10517/m.33440 type:complete len:312 (+) Transcript_10517:1863-2798(+)
MVRFSMYRSMSALTAVGVVTTTPACRRAPRSFLSVASVMMDDRSKLNVYTRFCRMDANVERSTERENSSSAGGTTSTTRCRLSPSIRHSMGDTTVVLPEPMMSCRTMEPPPCSVRRNSSIMFTCGANSTMFHTNSNTRYRGSNDSVDSSTKCRRAARFLVSLPSCCRMRMPRPSDRWFDACSSPTILRRLRLLLSTRFSCPMRVPWQMASTVSASSSSATRGVTNGFTRARSAADSRDSRAPIRKSTVSHASTPATRDSENWYASPRPCPEDRPSIAAPAPAPAPAPSSPDASPSGTAFAHRRMAANARCR